MNMNVSITWRRLLAAMLLAWATLPAVAQAPAFPSRPVKLVVPYSAGSGTDMGARVLSDELQNELGVAVIVENRPGANGTIGSNLVAKAPADGYTLLMGGSSTHSSAPSLYKALPYDPDRDFEMIANVVESVFVLVVRSDSPINTVKDLTATLQTQGGKASYGYGSATTQIAGASFLKRMGLTATPVPYKSTPPTVTDLIGGIVTFIFLDQASALPHIKGGRVRALAVAGQQRVAEMPGVPTFAEAGLPNFDVQTWVGILVPRGVPQAVADHLTAAMGKVMTKRSVVERLSAMGRPMPPAPRTVFPAYLQAQRESWASKIKDAGIQPE